MLNKEELYCLNTFYDHFSDGAYREEQNKTKLPKIPVQPIGYDEAEEFFK
jgi:hypothetical protein